MNITLDEVIARYLQEPDFEDGLKAAQAELEEELATERSAFTTVTRRIPDKNRKRYKAPLGAHRRAAPV